MSLRPPSSSGPLAGITVVEVASVVMAPLAGRLFAKLGATVVRVEPPHGDVVRRIGSARKPGMTGAALALGDGKYSLAVDAKSRQGRDELRRLIRMADIVVTNHPPRRRGEYGLDWESVSAINPRAILCTSQGYASDSVAADRPAYDDTVQAASGVCDIYAKAHGRPRYAPYVMADKICGLTIVYSTLAALHHRNVTDRGQWVDVPMVDVMVDFNLTEQLNEHTFAPPLGPAGWHRTLAPSRAPHRCRDGWVTIMPYSDRNWRDFLRLSGNAGPGEDVVYASNQERNENMDQVQSLIAGYASGRTARQIVAECDALGIPVQPVNSIESLLDDEYLTRRGTVEQVDHPTEGIYWRTTPNITFSGSPLAATRPATRVDADREEIMALLRFEQTTGDAARG